MKALSTGLKLSVSLMLLASLSTYAFEGETQFITEDFYVRTLSSKSHQRLKLKNSQNCRAQIKEALCLVEPPKKGEDPLERSCEAGGEAYASYFEALYDSYPESLQKMFCSLNFIFIEKKSDGTAYAGLVKDKEGNILGAQMGIRKSVLDENLDLKTWATWKEQLSFGGVADSYTLKPDLPFIETQSHVPGVNDFLYFVISHEFAHIFDFANKVNHEVNCEEQSQESEDDPRCDFKEGSWGLMSWLDNKSPLPKSDFEDRNKVCFYWCDGNPLSFNLVNKIYERLAGVNFISLYGTRQAWDDFADATAYYLMHENLKTSYVIDTRQGQRYDIIEKLYSPLMKDKLDYLKDFYSRKDILYP